MEDRRRRPPRWLVALIALVTLAALAIPALGSSPINVTVDPAATAGTPGFTDLDSMTYAEAKGHVDELSEITLPVNIPGLERIDVSDVALGSNDAGRSLSLSGSAELLDHDVDLIVTAIWPDDQSTEPQLAIAAKADDLPLSELNPLWDDTYGDVSFATARLAVSTADQEIDPAALPAAAQDFYAEPVELTGGVNFAGTLDLTGRLADAFGYAGYAGGVELEGTLAGSAAALFGRADARLGDLRLKTTLRKSPTAPAWIAERTSTYEFALEGGAPSLSIDEDLSVALDGATHHFNGNVTVAPAGAIEGRIALDGTLELGRLTLSDVDLRLSRERGDLAVDVDVDGSPVRVTAAFSGAGAEFGIEGPITAPKLAAFGGKLLGTPVNAVPAADDVSLDGIRFSLARGIFSVGADATIKELQAKALFTLRGGQPLLGLRLTDVRMAALLPADKGGDLLRGLEIPELNLTATSLTELAADELTAPERQFFGDVEDTMTFTPGLNFDGRLPLHALGMSDALTYPAGSEVALVGTLDRTKISLAATLPAGAKLSILPQWVKASGPTTLSFDGLAAKFGTEAEVTVGGKTLKTVIEGRVTRSGQRTSIGFTGTISNWKNPFNVSWLTSLDKAEVRLDTSFGGGRQAEVKADISASARLGGKDFTLGFALSNGAKPTATVTATAQTGAMLGEIAKVFTNDLAGAARDVANNPKLNNLAIGPVTASLSSDRKLALTASATFEGLRSELLVVARTNQFTLGIKTREAVDLEKLAGVPGITLPKAAMVLGNSNGDRSVASLTDGEFDFYKTLYGCAENATRGECTKFTRLSLTRGLTLLAGFDLGEKMTEAAGAIGVQTGNAILAGTLPVLGGKLSLSASLGDLRFANAPDWFHSGQMKLEINDGGVALAGTLRVKIDDDLLAFTVRAELGFQPVRIALSGELIPEGDGIWRNAFGQDWLSIKRLALQIEVTGTADVTFGFQGDVDINGKDIAAALKVGISPIPPFRPNLIGFSAASRAGLTLKDLLWLNERITNVKIDPDKLPDIGVRNLFLQFSQQDDPELCLKQGVRFNAELYLGTPGQKSAGDEGDLYDDKGCRNLDVKPAADNSCDRETDGCLARVYGRLDSGGLLAGGQLDGFELGPVEFEDSLLALELTRDTQSLRVKGGLRIATDDYEFAEGRADLEISRTQFKFSGDASLFNDELQGYLRASAAFDLENPSFEVEAWLRAGGRDAVGKAVADEARPLQPAIAAFGELLRLIGGGGSLANVGEIQTQFEKTGEPMPADVAKMADLLARAQADITKYAGPVLTLDALLKGFTFGFEGTPGLRSERTCGGFVVVGGQCWITPPGTIFGQPVPGTPGPWIPGKCIGQEVNGKCYSLPPAQITFGGLCSALGVPSNDCSWAGVMRRVVRPVLIAAVESVVGDVPDDTFDIKLKSLVERFANLDGYQLVNVECAYFHADASELAKGNVNVTLATKLRLFGQTVQFGADWDFTADDNPRKMLAGILHSLFWGSTPSCPATPGEQSPPANSQAVSTTLTPTVMEEDNPETTLRVTFKHADLEGYPGLKVDWADGTSSTIPAGQARTVSATHRYKNHGKYPVKVVVADSGAFSTQATATVTNIAPSIGFLEAEPMPVTEGGVMTLRGRVIDRGAADTHTVKVDWGDGSPAETHVVDAASRMFALPHRYRDDQTLNASVVVTDDGGATATAGRTVLVVNARPTDLEIKPVRLVTAAGEVPSGPVAHEGDTVIYAATFKDAGEGDSHEVTVDWGDGRSADKFDLAPGRQRIEIPHRYADSGTYRVIMTVHDKDGPRAEILQSTFVRNVAPVVTARLQSTSIALGATARIAGTIADPGPDHQTVTIDWGAGLPAAQRYQVITLEPGKTTFEAERQFAVAGRHTIGVTVLDDDYSEGKASAELTVG